MPTASTAAKELATLVRGRVLRTNVQHRPFPSVLNFPGLNTAPWWDTAGVPWAKYVEEHTSTIREEYDALIASKKPSDYELQQDEHTLHAGKWDWHSFVSAGKVQDDFVKACPATAGVLNEIPNLMTGIPFAYSFFSTLAPGSTISPHFGASNLKLRCHLPLYSPQQNTTECALRVAGIPQAWKPGKLMMFDDSYEHEAYYSTSPKEASAHASARVVLLFDVWHPDLSGGEITAITDLLGEIAAREPDASGAKR